ncbi:MAG TPA: GNAT family N-acetyltransferase [Chloroflexia bacterium]|nr:GNAT family N-acetyltransferase [Chloroflexia bacterium]
MATPNFNSVIRKVRDEDYDAFANLIANAYPGIKLFSEEARERYKQRMKEWESDPKLATYGLFRDDQLVGGMRFFDFTMKILSTKGLAGGIGMVAVDLLHKKEKVAYELLSYFLKHYRERGATMALLYPFRPDFYHKMGFGLGAKISQYRAKPSSLPSSGNRQNVYFLTKTDEQALLDCYNRCLERSNGLVEKLQYELNAFFDNPEMRVVGYRPEGENGPVTGYIAFSFKQVNPDSFVLNNIICREVMHESSEALLGLLAFLQSQADQIKEIVFNIQDDYFHHILLDPRNNTDNMIPSVYHESNTQGVGIMYRVLDTRGFFRLLSQHNFNGQSCKLKLTVRDSFFPANNGSLIVHFKEGLAELEPEDSSAYEVEIALDVAEFSSLVMGAVDFKQLYRYGLVTLSDPGYVSTLHRLFQTEERPVCTTPF